MTVSSFTRVHLPPTLFLTTLHHKARVIVWGYLPISYVKKRPLPQPLKANSLQLTSVLRSHSLSSLIINHLYPWDRIVIESSLLQVKSFDSGWRLLAKPYWTTNCSSVSHGWQVWWWYSNLHLLTGRECLSMILNWFVLPCIWGLAFECTTELASRGTRLLTEGSLSVCWRFRWFCLIMLVLVRGRGSILTSSNRIETWLYDRWLLQTCSCRSLCWEIHHL